MQEDLARPTCDGRHQNLRLSTIDLLLTHGFCTLLLIVFFSRLDDREAPSRAKSQAQVNVAPHKLCGDRWCQLLEGNWNCRES